MLGLCQEVVSPLGSVRRYLGCVWSAQMVVG